MENIKSRELLPEAAPLALWAIFFSPLATIESLSRRPRWFIPLLITGIYSSAVSYYVIARFGFAALVAKSAQASSQLDPTWFCNTPWRTRPRSLSSRASPLPGSLCDLGAHRAHSLASRHARGWRRGIQEGAGSYGSRCSVYRSGQRDDACGHRHTKWRPQLFRLQQPVGNQSRFLCPQQLQVYRSHFQRARHRHDRHSGPAGVGVDQGFQTGLPDRGMARRNHPLGSFRNWRGFVFVVFISR